MGGLPLSWALSRCSRFGGREAREGVSDLWEENSFLKTLNTGILFMWALVLNVGLWFWL